MRLSHSIVLGAILAVSIILLGGCKGFRKNSKPQESSQSCEAAYPIRLPFLGDDVHGASATVQDNLKPLFRVGYIFLATGGILGLALGVKAGAGLALGGILATGAAVLFSEYPRAVLVFPLCGLPVLILWAALWFRRLWRAHKTIEVLVPTIDDLDTGPRSAGRRLKQKIEESGFAGVVRRGIEYIKRLYRKDT